MTTEVQSQALDRLRQAARDPRGYVEDWKLRTGGLALGIFPMNFPVEITHAAGVLPVMVQAGDEAISDGNYLLTEYYCGFTRSVADQASKGQLDHLDGFMSADHCIELMGAVDVVRESLPDRKVFYGQFIAVMGHDWMDRKLRATVEEFISEMETFSGSSISTEDLHRSIGILNENRSMIRQIFQDRREGRYRVDPTLLQDIVKSSMIMDRQEHTALLREVADELASQSSSEDGLIRVHLSGHFCHAPNPDLLTAIEDCGAIVVDDDLFTGYRYVSTDVPEDSDPVEAICAWYQDRNTNAPCPTRVQHDIDWDGYLVDSVRNNKVDAVLVLMAKFCEPHMLYYPEIRKALSAADIPHLMLETEHLGMPLETIRTRLEALFEGIRRRSLQSANA
ncbi:r-phenyllactate dehydratase small subunit [Citricoccus zhacaiensis]|uniref:R-phenyllactate dehydratase small subunit n=1 Tax=Citricoccus zhacaiensis TaxID=489142 RepID=A0ABQ2LVU4_9MICC|nr:2-hydroxyacyl-CoA dehydratase family protein [Citricoccus zhacaiensis]GGO43680.1 r-phenyllactate dehydratase small subunit [Citricoccus zhacaiensis]